MKRERQVITVPLLILIIAVLVIQNYLLVRTNDDLLAHNNALKKSLWATMMLTEEDSIRAFSALDVDNGVWVVDPSGHKSTALFVFTSSCEFCRKNVFFWNRISYELEGTNTLLLGVSPDPIQRIEAYQEEVRMSFKSVSLYGDTALQNRLKLHSFPQTILVDSFGSVIGVWGGVLDSKTVGDIVGRLTASTTGENAVGLQVHTQTH